MTWYMVVAYKSKKDAPALDREFFTSQRPNTEATVPCRPCLFDKYRRGDVEPRSSKKKGCSSIVERVEERYPNTAKWLESPLWDAMDFDHVSVAGIREIYEGLPDEIGQHFLALQEVSAGGFWRKPTNPEIVYSTLVKYDSIASLTASFNMAREGLLFQNQRLHYYGLRGAEEVLARMKSNDDYWPWLDVIGLMQNLVASHRNGIKYSHDGEYIVPIP